MKSNSLPSIPDVDAEMAQLDRLPGSALSTVAALASGHAMQQVRTPWTTALAVQKPRSLAEVQRRLCEEAALAGEEFYYGWGAGKDKIEGPSIELAVAAARCWGNCATDMGEVQNLADAWVFKAVFIDLETGYTRSRQFRQSKNARVAGRHDEERKADIRFQIGQSKAERNVILKALPAALIRCAMEEAKKGVRARIEQYIADKGMPAAVDLLLRAFKKLGVEEKRILAKFDVAEAKGLAVEHLVLLKGDLHAIQQGQERAEELFPLSQTEKLVDMLGKKAAGNVTPEGGALASPLQLGALKAALAKLEVDDKVYREALEARGVIGDEPMTAHQAEAMLAWLEAQGARAITGKEG